MLHVETRMCSCCVARTLTSEARAADLGRAGVRNLKRRVSSTCQRSSVEVRTECQWNTIVRLQYVSVFGSSSGSGHAKPGPESSPENQANNAKQTMHRAQLAAGERAHQQRPGMIALATTCFQPARRGARWLEYVAQSRQRRNSAPWWPDSNVQCAWAVVDCTGEQEQEDTAKVVPRPRPVLISVRSL